MHYSDKTLGWFADRSQTLMRGETKFGFFDNPETHPSVERDRSFAIDLLWARNRAAKADLSNLNEI